MADTGNEKDKPSPTNSDMDFIQKESLEWMKDFFSKELQGQKQERDIADASVWIKDHFEKTFRSLGRAGGWRRLESPSSIEGKKYDNKTDSICFLILFGDQFTEAQVEQSVDIGFFSGMKRNRPRGCKGTAVTLMATRGFIFDVPSGTRCGIFKLWVRYSSKHK